MTRLFGPDGAPRPSADPAGHWGASQAEQIAAIETVLPALAADLLLIVEAPDDRPTGRTLTCLGGLADALDLAAARPLMGFSNETGQELAMLYNAERFGLRHAPVGDPAAPPETDPAPRFDRAFHIDLDIDDRKDVIRFSKPPLEVVVEPVAGPPFRVIGCHVKSKAPHGATSPEDAVRRAIAARRKQLAQCIWLRRRIEQHLDDGIPVVVMGDLNDGPGLDRFETLFGRSGLEIVLGEGAPASRRLYDRYAREALGGRMSAQAASARFFLQSEGRWLSALLDYVMISPDLMDKQPRWRIWHPFDDAEIAADPVLREALLKASDHFPVTLDLEI